MGKLYLLNINFSLNLPIQKKPCHMTGVRLMFIPFRQEEMGAFDAISRRENPDRRRFQV